MADIDASNPLALVVAFFGLFLLSITFLVKIVQSFAVGGIIGGLFMLGGGAFVWWKEFYKG